MKQFIRACGLAAVLVATGLASGAWAEVVDRAGVLTGSQIQQLEQDLDRLGRHRVELVLEETAGGGSPSAAAERVFRDERLTSKDVAIFVAVKERKVGVHVGEAFVARGVDSEAISRHLQSDFYPAAKRGDYQAASLALAKGLIAEGARAGSGRARASQAQGSKGGSDGGGAALVVVLLLMGGGVGFLVWNGRRQQRADLDRRLATLKGMHEQVVSQSLKLDEVESLARFAEGGAAEGFRKLVKRSNQVMAEVRAFGERLEQAEAALKAGRPGPAGELVGSLEEQAAKLTSGLAATLTAVERLESGKGNAADADLPERAEKLAARFSDLTSSYQAELKRARSLGVSPDIRLERELADGLKCLTTMPIDLKSASEAYEAASGLLDSFIASLKEAEERRAYEERTREMSRANSGNGAFIAGAMLGSMLDGDHHHGDDAWGGGDGASADGGWGDSGSSDGQW